MNIESMFTFVALQSTHSTAARVARGEWWWCDDDDDDDDDDNNNNNNNNNNK